MFGDCGDCRGENCETQAKAGRTLYVDTRRRCAIGCAWRRRSSRQSCWHLYIYYYFILFYFIKFFFFVQDLPVSNVGKPPISNNTTTLIAPAEQQREPSDQYGSLQLTEEIRLPEYIGSKAASEAGLANDNDSVVSGELYQGLPVTQHEVVGTGELYSNFKQ